jgi:hypothetical protein
MKRRNRFARGLAAITIAVLVGWGSSSSGADGAGGPSASTPSGIVNASCRSKDSGTDACGTCLGQSCCLQESTCSNNADCASLLVCAKSCGDERCVDDCERQFPKGKNDLDAFLGCYQKSCASECAGNSSGGGSCNSGSDSCSTCVDRSCCPQEEACDHNQACSSLLGCLDQCDGDPRCESACRKQHPDGAKDLAGLVSCLNDDCGAACRG